MESMKNDKTNQLTPFDFVKSIQTTKTHLIREADQPDVIENFYVPFIVNKALSNYVDSIYYANNINGLSHASNLMQYDYYINSIRKMNRKFSWNKKQKDETLELISQYFHVNLNRAKEIYSILTKEQLKEVKDLLLKNKNNKRKK